jgi:hypothetical protein
MAGGSVTGEVSGWRKERAGLTGGAGLSAGKERRAG